MDTRTAADRVEVLVLVDNTSDFLSSVPEPLESEISRFWRRGARLQAGRLLCCAAHGFSCAITAWRGASSRTLMFDAGPDGALLEANVERLGFDAGSVDGLFLSHGHWDHAGGMLRALELIRARNGGRAVPTFMHPDIYRSRAMKAADGTLRPFDDVPTAEQLRARGADLRHASTPQWVLDDLFFISGEIPRITPFETGMPGQQRRTADGSGWEPDPWLHDERYVAVRIAGLGVFVFSACSHAGIVNVLHHAQARFPGERLHGLLGGLHLAGSTEALIPQTVAALGEFGLALLAPAHCTGWRAVAALAAAFGPALAPSAVGKTYRLVAARPVPG